MWKHRSQKDSAFWEWVPQQHALWSRGHLHAGDFPHSARKADLFKQIYLCPSALLFPPHHTSSHPFEGVALVPGDLGRAHSCPPASPVDRQFTLVLHLPSLQGLWYSKAGQGFHSHRASVLRRRKTEPCLLPYKTAKWQTQRTRTF